MVSRAQMAENAFPHIFDEIQTADSLPDLAVIMGPSEIPDLISISS